MWGSRIVNELDDIASHNSVGANVTMAPNNSGMNPTPEVRLSSGRVSLRDFPRFSGAKVDEFFEKLELQMTLSDVPQELKRTLLPGLLDGEAKAWYRGLGRSGGIQEYDELKRELSEAFPQCGNRNARIAKFYSAKQRRGEKPTSFIAELAGEVEGLGLRMSEIEVVEHIVYRLEPRARDYIELRDPQTRGQLYKVARKYEERKRDEERWDREREPEIPRTPNVEWRMPQPRRWGQEQWRGEQGAGNSPRYQSHGNNRVVERSPQGNFNRYQGPRDRESQRMQIRRMSSPSRGQDRRQQNFRRDLN